MRPRPCIISVCACLGLLNSLVRAESKNANGEFLEVYEDCVVADELEHSGDGATALVFYKEAAVILNRIAAHSPQWIPSIVNFQKKKTAEAIARLSANPQENSATQARADPEGALGNAGENGAPDEKTSKRFQARLDKVVKKMLREAKAKFEVEGAENQIGPWTQHLGMPGPHTLTRPSLRQPDGS